MKPFDLIAAPLAGTNLIEASAGTGKTYTIAGLYLRLVLERNLSVDQILVVTFTKAATEELRQRIRERLLQAQQALETGHAADPFLARLVGKVSPSVTALERIVTAIRDFDTCSIFTIHGFCQRILHENAFETGSLFDTDLITDQRSLLSSAVDDFWRRKLYGAPIECVRYALLKLKNPAGLVNLVEMSKGMRLRVIPEGGHPGFPSLERFRDCCREIAAAWPAARQDVKRLLGDPVLNGKVYGSLKGVDEASGLTRRQITIDKLVAAMDGFCGNPQLRFPLFKDLHKLSAATLTTWTNKGQPPPSHPFFSLGDDLHAAGESLLAEMRAWLTSVKADVFQDARKMLAGLKRQQNVQHFEDLLTRVRDSLDKKGGDLLTAAVRHRYRAAMVDEFQDTDVMQYEIFSKLFATAENSLFFMIGDPKQSIYGFRGADIFSYLQASRDTEHKFTLVKNYRSDARLVSAVNTLFSKVSNPFVFRQINYEQGVAAADEERGPQSGLEGEKKAFELWYLGASAGKPLNKAAAETGIAAAVAGDVAGLVHGPERSNPGDIAVLVRTNHQAGVVQAQLTARRVPAVIYNAGNVFETRDARDLFLVLTGIADPRDPRRLKAALATGMMGTAVSSLEDTVMDPSWWEGTLDRFSEYRRLWMTAGFMRMFNRLLSRENTRAHVLGLPDGERRLTNLLHLSELLHSAAVGGRLGVQALLKWFKLQRDPRAGIPETHQLRLESDARTVKIITIHKSKGLEFPVVYCPYAWGGSDVSGEDFTFHDPAADYRLSIDLGSADIDAHRRLARVEALAENSRLLYVALTRARERCVLAWGRISGAETSSLAYLLHYDENSPDRAAGNPESGQAADPDLTEAVGFQFRAKDDAALFRDLKRLEADSNHAIHVLPLPSPDDGGMRMPTLDEDHGEETLEVCRLERPIDSTWRITSYSALLSGHTPDAELPDRDAHGPEAAPEAQPPAETPAAQAEPPEGPGAEAGHTIFSFPKGPGAGIFFHELFELMDFVPSAEAARTTLIREKMRTYGFDSAWEGAVVQMTARVLAAPLDAGCDRFRLADVPRDQRINEMEFYFPLKSIAPDSLRRVFEKHPGGTRLTAFAENLGRLQFSPARGFMKGFIDLILRVNGRYYLLDWKSNYLGDALAMYAPESLDSTMQRSLYVLQYHIYTLALHRYLKLRLPGYRYERDFGGVFYLFVRGIDPDAGPGCGVFFDLPARETVEQLEQALMPE